MTRKLYPYSLKSEDAKIAGVCSTLSQIVGIDPTFLRIGFVASAIFISLEWTLVAYAVIGIYLAVKKRNGQRGSRDQSEFDRMGEVSRRPSTVHSMVNDLDVNDRRMMAIDHHLNTQNDLDVNDRRMMAIDHHLNTQNDELAREIEALRQEDK